MQSFAGESPTRLCAGPNKNDMFVYAGDNIFNVCELKHQEKERLAIWDAVYHEDDQKQPDFITAVEVDPNENIFYSGTKSGKVSFYKYFLVNSACQKYRWVPFDFVALLNDPIDDIHLAPCGEVLWILCKNTLYTYNRLTHEQLVKLELPELPAFAL